MGVFLYLMFVLHCAHGLYLSLARGKPSGLIFPGAELPDYRDFLYFAVVIGTSGQTADASLLSHAMHRLGLAHCIVSLFYITTVLALTINIAASVL